MTTTKESPVPRRPFPGLRAAFVLGLGFAVLGANSVVMAPTNAEACLAAKAEDPISAEAVEFMTAIEADFVQSINHWRSEQKDAMDAAIKAGGPIPAMAMMPPPSLFLAAIDDCVAAAATYEGKSDAIAFLVWITKNGRSADAKKQVHAAVDTLASTHMTSEHMTSAPEALAAAEAMIGSKRVTTLLRRLAQENPSPNVQASAHFVHLRTIITKGKLGSPEYKAARTTLLNAKAKCTDGELAASIQAVIDSREGLADGDLAPDISGVDMDGVAFKLSDYKGKIIMLDFWGDW